MSVELVLGIERPVTCVRSPQDDQTVILKWKLFVICKPFLKLFCCTNLPLSLCLSLSLSLRLSVSLSLSLSLSLTALAFKLVYKWPLPPPCPPHLRRMSFSAAHVKTLLMCE